MVSVVSRLLLSAVFINYDPFCCFVSGSGLPPVIVRTIRGGRRTAGRSACPGLKSGKSRNHRHLRIRPKFARIRRKSCRRMCFPHILLFCLKPPLFGSPRRFSDARNERNAIFTARLFCVIYVTFVTVRRKIGNIQQSLPVASAVFKENSLLFQ